MLLSVKIFSLCRIYTQKPEYFICNILVFDFSSWPFLKLNLNLLSNMKLTFLQIYFPLSSKPFTFYFEEYISSMINICNHCKLFLGKTNSMTFHFYYTYKHTVTHVYDGGCKVVCVYTYIDLPLIF